MTTETKPTDFGTSEDSRTVPAEKLEIGVNVSGDHFDQGSTVVVQDVDVVYTGKNQKQVRVTAANFNNGDVVTRFFRPGKPITTWGKL